MIYECTDRVYRYSYHFLLLIIFYFDLRVYGYVYKHQLK